MSEPDWAQRRRERPSAARSANIAPILAGTEYMSAPSEQGLCTKNLRHAVPHPHAWLSERHDQIVPAIAGRKRRKNVGTNVAVQARVPPHLREKAQRAAAALGVAMGAYLEQLMLRDQLDDSDKPAWAEDFYAEHPEFTDSNHHPLAAEAALQGLLLSA